MAVQNRFSKVTDEIITLLADIVGIKNVLTGENRENYTHDELLGAKPFLPEVVVTPENTESVAGILKLANQNIIPVTPRGGGTGLSGGATPIYGGIVISMEKLNKILEIDKVNFIADVEAGVPLSELYQAVAEQGLYYPLYPGEASAFIGGNVATNAAGVRAVKYGVTRNFVLGLEAVLPTGEIIKTGGKYIKCSTGYDLTQLIIGSEGTLAVITKVLLRLVPPPGKTEILLIPFNRLHNAISSVPDILKQGIIPVGMEFMQSDIVSITEQYLEREMPLRGYAAYLMLIIEGNNEDEIHKQANEIGDICLKSGAIDIFIPPGEKAKRSLIEFREKVYFALQKFGTLDIADVVVPRSDIADFVETSQKMGTDYGIPVRIVGHAGDGNLHLCLMGHHEDEELRKKSKELLGKIFELGVSMGGTISGEHGIGYAKRDYMHIAASNEKLELMKRLKLAFDPNNIMNPGKVLSI